MITTKYYVITLSELIDLIQLQMKLIKVKPKSVRRVKVTTLQTPSLRISGIIRGMTGSSEGLYLDEGPFC